MLNALLLALVLLVRLPVPARAHAAPWPSAIARRRVRHGERRAGLFRLDHAGGLQLLAGLPGLFLLALQGGGVAGALAARGMRWLFTAAATSLAAVLLGIATFSKPPNALLFAADPRCGWLWKRPTGRAFLAAERGVRSRCRRRALRHQHGDLRRVELPGRRRARRSTSSSRSRPPTSTIRGRAR